MPVLVEIKARCHEPARVRKILKAEGARFVGEDRQVDTYFQVPDGRLKLREGTIENNLIFYHRPDQSGPKRSDVLLHPTPQASTLKPLLTAALGVKVVVDKVREIYFIDNVKFHIDTVAGLGSFVEIEAIDDDHTLGEHYLRQQCDHFIATLGLLPTDFLTHSYSDMLLESGVGSRES